MAESEELRFQQITEHLGNFSAEPINFRAASLMEQAASLHGVQAGELLRQVVGRLGRAGGHDRRAGGYVVVPPDISGGLGAVQTEIRRRMLISLHCEDAKGQRLVPLREMLSNIQE